MIRYCIDCKEYPEDFMVNKKTWEEAGFKTNEGIICLTCFEKRLNRKLVINDFPDLIINEKIRFGYNMCRREE